MMATKISTYATDDVWAHFPKFSRTGLASGGSKVVVRLLTQRLWQAIFLPHLTH